MKSGANGRRSNIGCPGRPKSASQPSSSSGGSSMDLAPDFDEFIASLIAHDVEFVIVGAYALAFHGAPRFTGDLDVFVRPTIENASRLLAAVRAFGFPVAEVKPQEDRKSTRLNSSHGSISYAVFCLKKKKKTNKQTKYKRRNKHRRETESRSQSDIYR